MIWRVMWRVIRGVAGGRDSGVWTRGRVGRMTATDGLKRTVFVSGTKRGTRT